MAVIASAMAALSARAVTPLWERGHAVIPAPQKVVFGAASEIQFDATWSVVAATGISSDHIALLSLKRDLQGFHSLQLQGRQVKTLTLAVRAGTVSAPPEVAAQGYRLRISPDRIEITGNSDAGLFYGVQTFVQLLKAGPRGLLLLPECTIEDWPTLQLRFLHWDTKNHQDRMETLKRYLDWSARFKANMVGFEITDKFAFPSHPEIGAPGAFTTAELQELTRYGLQRFIQIVPVMQSPSHLMYALKHPQHASLRADGNNYQASLCNEQSYKLMFDLFDDVIRATPGVGFLFASTDEIYYASAGCTPDNEENRSLKWAEFAVKAHDAIAAKGRRMLAWLEYPLLAKDLRLIPSDVIDGVVGEEEYLAIERSKGMRQLGYLSLQGSEFLFPDHLPLDLDLREEKAEGADDPLEFERGQSSGRIQGVYASMSTGRFLRGNPIGAFGAAWDDSGLHNETFWLGWSAAARWAWNPKGGDPQQHTAEFMQIYYGPQASGMIEVYRSMQRQARTWQRTWDRVVSRVRGPGYGNSDGKGIGSTRHDQTLNLPEIPKLPNLDLRPQFSSRYRGFLGAALARQSESDVLIHALQENLGKASRNRYNLEVMLSLAHFTGHHWRLLIGLAEAEHLLEQASHLKPKEAIAQLATAHNRVTALEHEGEAAFAGMTQTFERSQFPKGQSVNGRQYLQVLDDTKDHWASRSADWSFMQMPERSMGLVQWRKQLREVITDFAGQHSLATPTLVGEIH